MPLSFDGRYSYKNERPMSKNSCAERSSVSQANSKKRIAVQKADALSRFLSELGKRKFQRLSQKSGFSISRLEEWRDDPHRPIKYVDALRIVKASAGEITMTQILEREVPDRERFDCPLGRKIATSLIGNDCLSKVLESNGITFMSFNRWLTENEKWTDETRQKIRDAFESNGIKITEYDFEEQRVERLRVRYEKARQELEMKRQKAA